MTVLRTDIERALNDLISNEEGMRFQDLAVVKQHWPEVKEGEIQSSSAAQMAECSHGPRATFGKLTRAVSERS
jgi:hypothetical protein